MSETIAYSDEKLMERAVTFPRNLAMQDRARWAIVRDIFCVGSTTAHAICKRFGANPDDIVKGQQI